MKSEKEIREKIVEINGTEPTSRFQQGEHHALEWVLKESESNRFCGNTFQ